MIRQDRIALGVRASCLVALLAFVTLGIMHKPGITGVACLTGLLLVLADNFALLYFGWEGVGLASYLLIGFWFTDAAKAAAGMKAFVTNRVGDVGLGQLCRHRSAIPVKMPLLAPWVNKGFR